MGIAIRSELCLGCGLCENVIQDVEILRITGFGIATIIDGGKIDDFIKIQKDKRRLLRSCPFGAIQEIPEPTQGVVVPKLKHNSIPEIAIV